MACGWPWRWRMALEMIDERPQVVIVEIQALTQIAQEHSGELPAVLARETLEAEQEAILGAEPVLRAAAGEEHLGPAAAQGA